MSSITDSPLTGTKLLADRFPYPLPAVPTVPCKLCKKPSEEDCVYLLRDSLRGISSLEDADSDTFPNHALYVAGIADSKKCYFFLLQTIVRLSICMLSLCAAAKLHMLLFH